MVPACQDHSYIFDTQKVFLKIPGFTLVYVLGVYIIFWQSVKDSSKSVLEILKILSIKNSFSIF